MNKFKVGDRVEIQTKERIPTTTSGFMVGDIGTITKIDKDTCQLDDESYGWVNKKDLKLIKTSSQEAYLKKQQFDRQMEKISELYTKDQVDEKMKELKGNCVDHIKVLRNHLRNRMREVDKLERELMRMENRLRNKDNIIRELSEVIIKITNEEED